MVAWKSTSHTLFKLKVNMAGYLMSVHFYFENVGPKKKPFSSHLLSCLAGLVIKLTENRLNVQGENIQSLLHDTTFRITIRTRPQIRWAVKAYITLWTEEKSGQLSGISKGK